MTDSVLDDELIFPRESPLLSIVTWWEEKRLTYSMILLFEILVIILIYREAVLVFGIFDAALGSIGYLLFANGFYCMGWGVEVLLWFHFKLKLPQNARVLFWLLGLLFSLFTSLVMYLPTLWALSENFLIQMN